VRFGVYVPTFGEYDVETLAEFAAESEVAGWDGFFIWDQLVARPDPQQDLADTTVALTAIALTTDRLRFGPLVTPLARRRPWKLAKEMATLDHLSGGRLVLGVGLGEPGDTVPFGEGAPPHDVAARLDESLELLAAFWRGEHVEHDGEHFRGRRDIATAPAAAASNPDLGGGPVASQSAVSACGPLGWSPCRWTPRICSKSSRRTSCATVATTFSRTGTRTIPST
jgi:alkanesulfonate monooxygenase SsuD/methylene tetrahydromethanopterin reductase-like flavin-dependent oxidoreductase (luciferase family)